ncbi:hypothetical protein ASPBRDRAFT_276989 [Aspergillus brasiliensis CBS 101740]|uniref:Uncharacterized protein n=1 Tax=Aspergillus brasiliensis (strain CBS 101740 / IMI 381727 / IBT 21946) TaxID=767769 RepID=A0A1L9UCN3_ASPBC|nr:hypothetical protein ASPBRDRAFT_276989 [Aspergillus brasiliensis CBS 101740]
MTFLSLQARHHPQAHATHHLHPDIQPLFSYHGPSDQTYRPSPPIVQHHNSFPDSQPASQQLLSSQALGALGFINQPDRQYPVHFNSNKVPRVAINLKQDDSQLRESLALVICSIRSTPTPQVLLYVVDLGCPPSNQLDYPADRPDVLVV